MTLNQANSKPQPKVNRAQLFGLEDGESENRLSSQEYIQNNPDDFFVRLNRILEKNPSTKDAEPQESKFMAKGEIIFQRSEITTEVEETTDIPENSSINEILNSTSTYTIKAAENVASFTGGMVIESAGAFADLFKVVTGKEGGFSNKEKPGEDKKGSEKLKKEQAALHAQAWNSELQAAQTREAQITEAKEEASSGIVGNAEQLAQAAGYQSGYEKVKNVYTRSFVLLKRAWDSLKAKKNETPVYISGKRSGQKGGDIRMDKASEGGRLSNTGGAGVG